METMTRESWTDERMDDLAQRVDAGFAQVRDDLRELRAESGKAASRRELQAKVSELRGEMKASFDKVEERFDKVDQRFESAEARAAARFDSLHDSIIRIGAGLFGTIVIGFLGLIATRM